jgi:hypothetical protein
MNIKQFRKNNLKHVRLDPIPRRFEGGKNGLELPRKDDDWILNVNDEGVIYLDNTRVPFRARLNPDHIHSYVSDPQRGGGYGFLNLTVQNKFGGNDLWIEPGVRPTERS